MSQMDVLTNWASLPPSLNTVSPNNWTEKDLSAYFSVMVATAFRILQFSYKFCLLVICKGAEAEAYSRTRGTSTQLVDVSD